MRRAGVMMLLGTATILVWQPKPAAARTEREGTLAFNRGKTEVAIDAGSELCVGMVDDEINWSVDRDGTMIVVANNGRSNQSALLVISCPDSELVYQLVYNTGAARWSESGSMNRAGSKAGWEAVAGVANPLWAGRSATAGGRYYDTSYEPINATVHGVSQSDGARSAGVGLDHHFKRGSIGYGYDRQLLAMPGSGASAGYARFRYRGMSVFGRQSSAKGDEGNTETAYISLPDPIWLTFLHERDGEGVTIDRLTRSVTLSGAGVTLHQLLSYVQIGGEADAPTRDLVDWKGRLAVWAVPELPVTMGWDSDCETKKVDRCKISELGIGTRAGWRGATVAARYFLIPHLTKVDLTWRAEQSLRYGLAIERVHGASILPEKLLATVDDNGADSASLLAEKSFEVGRWQHELVGAVPLLGSHPWQYFSMTTQSRVLAWGGQWSLSTNAQPFAAVWLRNVQVTYGQEIDRNINYWALQGFGRSLVGRVTSNISLRPIEGAQVACGDVAEATRVTTDDVGEFRCYYAASDRNVAIGVAYAGVTVAEAVSFEELERARSVAVSLRVERRVNVIFFVDANGDGELDAADERIPLSNKTELADELIVSFADTSSEGSELVVRLGERYRLAVNEGLLPFRYRVIKVYGDSIDVTETIEDAYETRVLLSIK